MTAFLCAHPWLIYLSIALGVAMVGTGYLFAYALCKTASDAEDW